MKLIALNWTSLVRLARVRIITDALDAGSGSLGSMLPARQGEYSCRSGNIFTLSPQNSRIYFSQAAVDKLLG